ncbi:MAG: transcriptional coactivator p15/PC4 family protein [Methyloceanibacter sp.]
MNAPLVIATIAKNSREMVRIALDEFRGVKLVDIRVMAQMNDPSGQSVPTKKGISLRIELLGELIAALRNAEAEAQRLGLRVDASEDERR